MEITGTEGADVVVGTGGDDIITGLGGDDKLSGSGGFDYIYGGDGNDYVDELGTGYLDGGNGDDVISGGFGDDQLVGDDGNDYLEDFNGNNVYSGGNGDDHILAFGASAIVDAGAGNDYVMTYYFSSITTVNLGDGDDTIEMFLTNTDLIVTGGEGRDAFRPLFEAFSDYTIAVTDFAAGDNGDILDLSSITAYMSDYDGANPFGDGRLRLVQVGANVVLQDSINHNGKYFTLITLDNINLRDLTPANVGGYALDGSEGHTVVEGTTTNDQLFGSVGDDIMNGLDGNDVLSSSNGLDILNGGNGDDILNGEAGNDTLDGGAGADTMAGGAGNDIYFVDSALDIVVEGGGGGTDTIYASLAYSLVDRQVENLILRGADNIDATGNALSNHLTGNIGKNTLNGGDGNDVIDGGRGLDIMIGGLGDDTYIVDNFSDSVIENTGEGTDTVIATKSWTLSADIEILQLNGSDNIDATGNDLNNTLVGNSGNNVLDGGAGADVMSGHKGDDVYIVDNVGDTVVESSGNGTDLVKASVSFSLSGQHIENLTLTGADNINATGNSLGNILTGNGGNNVLNGGVGADVMAGRAGDDSYVVDNAGDIVKELDGGGTDAVNASVTFTLAGQFIENLTLTGTSAINGTGNHLDNIIKGNNAANILNGGSGHDVLSGKGGADIFVFTAASGADTISDFSAAQNDSIDVSAYTHGTAHSAYITQIGSDTIVNLGHGNIITVQNTAMADVGAHMVW